MKMKIKHEYDDGPDYLTKGKVYEVIEIERDLCAITDDEDFNIVVHIPNCFHLGERPWTVVED